MPTKTSYIVGDALDITNLTLMATYDDKSTKIIGSELYCSPKVLINEGTQAIEVTYEDKTVSFNVSAQKRNSNVFPTLAIYDKRFADVPIGERFYENVVTAYEFSLMNGVSATAFDGHTRYGSDTCVAHT